NIPSSAAFFLAKLPLTPSRSTCSAIWRITRRCGRDATSVPRPVRPLVVIGQLSFGRKRGKAQFTRGMTENPTMAQRPLMALDRVGELVHAALEEIVARDGSAPAHEVLVGVEKRVHLTDVERSLNKSGIPRWETNLRFYTTSCV